MLFICKILKYKTMKKRLRKKLHRGGFQQYGISIMVPVTTESVEVALNAITDIANAHNLFFCAVV